MQTEWGKVHSDKEVISENPEFLKSYIMTEKITST